MAALEELGVPSIADLDALASLLADQSADVGYWAASSSAGRPDALGLALRPQTQHLLL